MMNWNYAFIFLPSLAQCHYLRDFSLFLFVASTLGEVSKFLSTVPSVTSHQ